MANEIQPQKNGRLIPQNSRYVSMPSAVSLLWSPFYSPTPFCSVEAVDNHNVQVIREHQEGGTSLGSEGCYLPAVTDKMCL